MEPHQYMSELQFVVNAQIFTLKEVLLRVNGVQRNVELKGLAKKLEFLTYT